MEIEDVNYLNQVHFDQYMDKKDKEILYETTFKSKIGGYVAVFGLVAVIAGIVGIFTHNAYCVFVTLAGFAIIPTGFGKVENFFKEAMKNWGPFYFLPKKLKKEIGAFNLGLEARKSIQPLVLKSYEPDLYKEEVQQWNHRRTSLKKQIDLVLNDCKREVSQIKAQEVVDKHRKALKQIETSLNVLEPLNPNARNTREYASLITAALAKQQLDKE